MKKCERTGESLAVFYIDLDNFKNINDEHGHDAGDMLLVEASRRLSSCIRITDTVARLGGDEFAVLLIDLTDTSRVDAVARHVNHMLSQPFRLHNIEVAISGSIGIAIYPDDGIDMNELINKADLPCMRQNEAARIAISIGCRKDNKRRHSRKQTLNVGWIRHVFHAVPHQAYPKRFAGQALAKQHNPQYGYAYGALP